MAARAWERLDEMHRWRSRPYEDDMIVIIARFLPNTAPHEITAASIVYDSFGGLSLTKLYRRQTNAIKLLNAEAWRSTRAQRRATPGETQVLLVPPPADTFRLLMPIANALSKPFRAGTVMRCVQRLNFYPIIAQLTIHCAGQEYGATDIGPCLCVWN